MINQTQAKHNKAYLIEIIINVLIIKVNFFGSCPENYQTVKIAKLKKKSTVHRNMHELENIIGQKMMQS